MSQRFVIDFWVTGQCNLHCPFCYGADTPLKSKNSSVQYKSYEGEARLELSLDQVKEIFLKLKLAGVTTINITGGEPFVRKDIIDLVKSAHEHFEIYLSTNGLGFFKHYERINEYIDSLSLPLDSVNDNLSSQIGRDKNHFSKAKNILEYFKGHPPDHVLKVGTVVSQINKNHIMEIGKFLFENSDVYPSDAWRLYQFAPHKRAMSSQSSYEIDTNEFLGICENVQTKFPGINISGRTKIDLENAYFFITPDGFLQVFKKQHETIADLLTLQAKDLIKIFSQNIPIIQKSRKNREWRQNLISEIRPTTSNDEILDIVNENDMVIGKSKRIYIYQNRQRFRVINIFLENSFGKIWISRRNPSKILYPLCLDNSAGGHVMSGEDYESAFRRELQEELNMDIANYDWKLMGYLTPQKNDISSFMKVYKIKTNETPQYNFSDFIDGFWIYPSEIMDLIKDGEPSKPDLPMLLRIFYQIA